MSVSVYYSPEYLNYIEKMPSDNEFIHFKSLDSNVQVKKDDIFILNNNSTLRINSNNIIKIIHEPQKWLDNPDIPISYDIQKVYLACFEDFVSNPDFRLRLLVYNIYHKILNLIDKDTFTLKYPIIFDPIETYLVSSLTDKSFFRIGDGQQNVKRGSYPNMPDKLVKITEKVLNKNYNYNKDRLLICYNDMYYGGILNNNASFYWGYDKNTGGFINGSYAIRQLENTNLKDIYYSSHAFKANSSYHSFDTSKIHNLLVRMVYNKDIIIINQCSVHNMFGYRSRIDINYGNESAHLSQQVVDSVMQQLNVIFTQNPKRDYTIFVKGAILGSLVVDTYYDRYRVCEIGSYNFALPKFTLTQLINNSKLYRLCKLFHYIYHNNKINYSIKSDSKLIDNTKPLHLIIDKILEVDGKLELNMSIFGIRFDSPLSLYTNSITVGKLKVDSNIPLKIYTGAKWIHHNKSTYDDLIEIANINKWRISPSNEFLQDNIGKNDIEFIINTISFQLAQINML